MFLAEKGKEHGRNDTKGRWYRCTVSVPWEIFDPLVIEHWLHPDDNLEGPEEDG